MKILMTADTIGGVWTYALDLIGTLDPESHRVTLATMGQPLSNSQWRQVAQHPHLTVFESTFKLEWMDDPWRDVEVAGRWLMELAARVEPDIVHLNGYVHATLPWSAPVIVVGHSCVRSWWRAVKGTEAPPRYDRYTDRVRSGLRAADMVVAPTEAMLAALVAEYGELARSCVVRNGRAAALFNPAAEKEPFIFSVGRLWDEAKNVRALDRAAAHVPWPVGLAGCEAHPSGSRLALQHAKALGVLAPAAVARYLGRASIYALPARYEPFGLSVLEAALSGCALVLGDIPSLRENWEGSALFVPPDGDEALVNALNLLLRDPQLRERLCTAACQRAKSFTLNRMGLAYEELYSTLQSDRREPVCGQSVVREAAARSGVVMELG